MNHTRISAYGICLILISLVAVGCAASKATQPANDIDFVRAQSRRYEGPTLASAATAVQDIDIVRAQSRSYEGPILAAAATPPHDIDMVRAQSRRYEGPVLAAAATVAQDIDIVRAQSRSYEGPVLAAASGTDIDVLRALSRRYEPMVQSVAFTPSQDIDIVRAQSRAYELSNLALSAADSAADKLPKEMGLTITIDPNNQCSVQGVENRYDGWLDYNLVVNGQANDAYYLAFYTLEDGKSLADLRATPESSVYLPPYANLLAMNFIQGGDLSHHLIKVGQGPFYLSCFVVTQGIIARVADLGPIPVIQN